MTPLPPCPHCGDTEQGVYVAIRWHGPGERWYNADGGYEESTSDRMYSRTVGPIRCAKCEEPRRDLTYSESVIVAKPAVARKTVKDVIRLANELGIQIFRNVDDWWYYKNGNGTWVRLGKTNIAACRELEGVDEARRNQTLHW